jgi:hypothetical protein
MRVVCSRKGCTKGDAEMRREGESMTREGRVTEHQVLVRLPGDLRNALYDRAEREDRPISRVIRAALRSYLGEEVVQTSG